ncbi:formylglycine-generating enzyme family protein [Desulfonatronovibrio magnus]|uniref:formylglycine-generating enzyme family protein n=1 Tax=Desulfonatronovibrio magnus TaxID=698827 RepID=UPI0006982289|nr:formylglycine-generating enzyme family protein [Desulfonatronovibrio magnus]
MQKFFFIGFFIFTLLAGTMSLNTSHAGNNLNDLQKANIIFDWLEPQFPELLKPAPQETQENSGIIFRYYSATNVYIATFQNHLFFIDHQVNLHDLGEVDFWLNYIREGEHEPDPGETWTDPVTGIEFVWVPEGCYDMGCGDWTDSCWDNEKPVHEVCLDGFWMGKYEVTQGQWTGVMGSNPSYFKSGNNYPVEQVSWNDVQDFISKLNSEGNSTFRLPTEAEWEYAARSGGRAEKYAGGDDLDSLGWYWSNSGSRTHEVGTKAPNGLGIYDMSGNVLEWVSDWYSDNYYSVSPRDNPQGPETGSSRVIRGGSWIFDAWDCRAAIRPYVTPGFRDFSLGFRLALSPGQQ